MRRLPFLDSTTFKKRYKYESALLLHTARARHRPALPAVAPCPWPVPLLKRHGVELAHDARAVCGRADHPFARPVMLLSWRAALALARGADMLRGARSADAHASAVQVRHSVNSATVSKSWGGQAPTEQARMPPVASQTPRIPSPGPCVRTSGPLASRFLPHILQATRPFVLPEGRAIADFQIGLFP